MPGLLFSTIFRPSTRTLLSGTMKFTFASSGFCYPGEVSLCSICHLFFRPPIKRKKRPWNNLRPVRQNSFISSQYRIAVVASSRLYHLTMSQNSKNAIFVSGNLPSLSRRLNCTNSFIIPAPFQCFNNVWQHFNQSSRGFVMGFRC